MGKKAAAKKLEYRPTAKRLEAVLSSPQRHLQDAQLLVSLLSISGKDGMVDFEGKECQRLWEVFPGLDNRLYALSDLGSIHFEQVGDDGFPPITILSTKPATSTAVLALLEEVSALSKKQSEILEEILGFDHDELKASIQTAEQQVRSVLDVVSKNDLLKPLEKDVKKISKYLETTKSVAGNYDEIYKIIVRPVQEEGKSGIRATVFWAILSIIVSFILSNIGSLVNLGKTIWNWIFGATS